ncbi:MAG: hypothetical protein H7Y14_01150 [Burkholderiales bacterium]|nr:hypothetical protein [Burkholderiales bacterium]
MGIKNWFGGDKKKEEFREKAKEALAGKLKPTSAADLEKVAKQHDIDNPGDDKTQLRRDIYNKAVGSVRAQGKLSEGEVSELAKIQKFLALRDDQVERTKWDLAKLRTLTEIRRGQLPVVPSNSAAMRGVQLLAGETAHYAVPVEVLDRASASGQPGVRVKWGTPYVINSSKGHAFPTEGSKELGGGYLFITNKRLFFKGERGSAAVEYSPQANFFLYREGIRLERTVGHTLLKFKSRSDETAEIVGELLSALMR